MSLHSFFSFCKQGKLAQPLFAPNHCLSLFTGKPLWASHPLFLLGIVAFCNTSWNAANAGNQNNSQ